MSCTSTKEPPSAPFRDANFIRVRRPIAGHTLANSACLGLAQRTRRRATHFAAGLRRACTPQHGVNVFDRSFREIFTESGNNNMNLTQCIQRSERELESARTKILRDPLTATCDGGTFWPNSEFEMREPCESEHFYFENGA